MGRKKKEKAEEIKNEVKEIVEGVAETVKDEVRELTEETAEKIAEKAEEIVEGKEEKRKRGRKKKEEAEEEKKPKISKKELEEKARKLAEKISEIDVKGKLEEEREKEKEKKKTLIPIEDYVKYSAYIGTKVITPHMREFVYRRRNDGIAIINTNIIDKRLREMAELMAKYNPEDFIVVCKREAGWKAVEAFSRLTNVRIFTKKYPAGILTNAKLPNFFETEMVFVCDPWLDKNSLHDAKRMKKKIYAVCDTNNYTPGIDFFVPANNKSGKSLGLIFYILAREYCKAKGIKAEVRIEDFIEEENSN